MNPKDLKYSKEHEWVRVEPDGNCTVGITEFATESLGDVVFLELPEVGSNVKQFEQMGEVESVKAVSVIYSPVSGRVVERNTSAIDSPEVLNTSPFEAGWLVKVALSDKSELDTLLSAEEYETFLKSEEH